MRPSGEVKNVNKKYTSNMFLYFLRISGLVDAKLLFEVGSKITKFNSNMNCTNSGSW